MFADLLTTIFERRYRLSPLPKRDNRRLETLTKELIGSTSETSGLAAARQILRRYHQMSDEEKLAFFRHLAADMDVDPDAVRSALDDYEAAPSRASYRAYLGAAEPGRQELIRRLNQVPGATGDIVRMRADLARLGQGEDALQALDLDFRHLLSSWFNRGFLVLRPINWESPASILEKIIAYEAVHAIDSWDDLRLRLVPPDRRCFAFFHPAMPDEPLIFVEVALTRGVPGSIQDLLTADREPLDSEAANTAVFYSISNCQPGLAGVSFGNFLIKQVASDLAAELPGLKTFVTLSPIPLLTRWLDSQGLAWDSDNAKAMQAHAARYLLTAKRDDGKPYDPVARFHLGNGATVHAVHGGADTSKSGFERSGGAMVSYLYDLARVTQNHERFATENEVLASQPVRALAAQGERNAA